MRLKQAISAIGSLRGELASLWNEVRVNHLTQDEYLAKRRARVLDRPEYKALPRWAQAELTGYDMAQYDMVWALLSFAYEIDGKRIVLKSIEWNACESEIYERQRLGEITLDNGQHVWTDCPEKAW